MEAIVHLVPDLVPNWEPFHARDGTAPAEWGWRPSPADVTGRTDELAAILTMRDTTQWTVSRATLGQCLRAERVLAKLVRANQLAPTLGELVALPAPPIVLVRHPVAVVRSQLRAFHPDDTTPARPHYREALQYETSFERLMYAWYREHHELTAAAARGALVIGRYETLVNEPTTAIPELLDAAGIAIDARRLSSFEPSRPSSSDFENQLRADVDQQLAKGAANGDERAVMARFAAEFDCDLYEADVAGVR